MTDIAQLIKAHTDGVELKMADYKSLASELGARMDHFEQKMHARDMHGGGGRTVQSLGEKFVNEPGLKEFQEFNSRPSRFSMQTKTTITSAIGSAGDMTTPFQDGALALPKRSLVVRDLIPTIQVSTGSVEYPRILTAPSSAATVAEAALKPESAMTTDLVTVPIRTIAHWIPATRQILDDAPMLKGVIDTELLYGLKFAEDNQILNGSGAGTDLNGVYTQATAFAAGTSIVVSPNKIDVVLYAILQNALANLPATGVVLHPSDWTSMLSIKDSQGRYIIGDPQGQNEPRLFGLPVVLSLAMSAGTFLVGDFATSATLYDRWEARIEVSTEHADYFVRNMVAILCEERIGLAVKRPLGFTKGTFSTAIIDLTS